LKNVLKLTQVRPDASGFKVSNGLRCRFPQIFM
jgi:hypothetical protein